MTTDAPTDQMPLSIPDLALVLLVGLSGSGKSRFATRHFRPTEVVSSDVCRGLVSDDENDQAATPAAFDVLHYIAGKRLAAGRLTVVDATNLQAPSRASLLALAKAHHVLAVAIVLDVPEAVCRARNASREDRTFGDHVLRNQARDLARSQRGLKREGFHQVSYLRGVDEIEAATIVRRPLWTDRRDDHGPFDIVGDVHGCFDELMLLLGELGYRMAVDGRDAEHPDGRRALFVGDLVDRGPATPAVLRLVMGMVAAGHALCVAGNHESKLERALAGRKVTVSHGLGETLEQLKAEPEPDAFEAEVATFLRALVSHFVLDAGRLVVAHAGLPEAMHGRASGAVRAFALYGDTSGETDEFGLPVRYPWAEDHRGEAVVVYGHTPVPEARWLNNTICVDTGCVFGGRLTALRYPERELVSVPAVCTYYEPVRPLAEPPREPTELDLTDVTGKRILATSLMGTVTIREENAVAALEVMSRFAVDPRWLVYLPPTMAPPATSKRPGLLEHPAETFAEFARDGVEEVICQEKHMGSRAVVVVCRDASVSARRFGFEELVDPGRGVIVTRTGRRFFADATRQAAVLDRVAAGLEAAGLWDELATDWMVLDTELLPWSAKAEDLVRHQYAAVGAAGGASLAAEVAELERAAARGLDVADALDEHRRRAAMVKGFVEAYGRYCWPVDSVADLRIAPFQILAGAAEVYARRDHRWHQGALDHLCATDPTSFRPTRAITVVPGDEASVAEGIRWWEALTAGGGEGMVVKPAAVIHRGRRSLTQPGVKCRGVEYLRIVYGPEYTAEANLERLRDRSLGRKRSLALREFALGIEALDRFVAGDPLHRVHECVFGVLALESEPVDPRL